MLRGFAGNEDDAAPVFLEHAGQIFSREPHAAEHVDLEEAQPLRVGNFQERLGIEDAEIVDQHIGVRRLLQKRLDAGRGAEIGGDAAQVRVRERARGFFRALRSRALPCGH